MTSGALSVGAVGAGPAALVDPTGAVAPPGAGWTCEWWIGADDRWRVPAHEVAVRQHRIGDVAVVETAMRVPGGDALARVYGIGGEEHPIVVEVENRSPAPFVAAFVIRGASRVQAEGTSAVVDRAFVLSWARAPSRWARTVGEPVLVPVSTGRASTGDFLAVHDRGGRVEAAFLHPVAHRTTIRMLVTRTKSPPALDVRTVPDAAAVVHGWSRVLERGMQIRLPEQPLERRIRAARAEVLLRGQASRPAPEVVAALEDWGFDAAAAEAWRRLGTRDRRRAATRSKVTDWARATASSDDAALLLAVRRLLVDDASGNASVTLCAALPDAWRGQALEVRDAPTAHGTVSYALRWHGARVALLWDAPEGVELRIPALDPSWVSPSPHGEALLVPINDNA